VTHPALILHGAGTLRENGHDQDNGQCPIQDALTRGSVGYRRTRDSLFNGVIGRARWARFESNALAIG